MTIPISNQNSFKSLENLNTITDPQITTTSKTINHNVNTIANNILNDKSQAALENGTKVIDTFIESIKRADTNAKIYISIAKKNGTMEGPLRYLPVNNMHFPIYLLADDISSVKHTTINVSDIQSIKINPKIAIQLLNKADLEKLSKMGITFDSQGIMQKLPKNFTYEAKLASDNTQVTIFKDNKEVVRLNSKIVNGYATYCNIFWENQ